MEAFNVCTVTSLNCVALWNENGDILFGDFYLQDTRITAFLTEV